MADMDHGPIEVDRVSAIDKADDAGETVRATGLRSPVRLATLGSAILSTLSACGGGGTQPSDPPGGNNPPAGGGGGSSGTGTGGSTGAGAGGTTGSGTAPLSCLGLSAAAAASLSACGGTVQPFETMTEARAARLLCQGGLGATPDDVAALVRGGADAWFDAQLALPVPISVYDWAKSKGFDTRFYALSDYGLDQALWMRLCTAPDVLRQRVVLALSEIFVVSPLNMVAYWRQFVSLAWWELLEQHCFGNFRDLLTHITLSPAMGVYLSMRGSAKADASGRHPDENYARELLQLFSIGLSALNLDGSVAQPATDTYTADTITDLARVFTGWDVDGFNAFDPTGPFDYVRVPMGFHADRHDDGQATVLGVTIPAGTPGTEALSRALDAVFAHPNVGPFIARQLIQRLVCSNPSPAYVTRVAMVFNASGTQPVRGDLAMVVRAVLSDPEARPDIVVAPASEAPPALPTLTDGKLREPVLRLLQWLRLSAVTSTDGNWNFPDLSGSEQIAQAPMRSPSVFNFFRPGYVPPSTAIAAKGLVAPEFQITNESSVMGYANFLIRILPFGDRGILPNYTRWIALADTPASLVDQLNLYLTGRTLSGSTVATIVTAVSSLPIYSDTERRNRVVTAFFLIMCCPQYLVQR
jgi:uncharacterized protein (DUF1800 family)